jgi:hypothetical protein
MPDRGGKQHSQRSTRTLQQVADEKSSRALDDRAQIPSSVNAMDVLVDVSNKITEGERKQTEKEDEAKKDEDTLAMERDERRRLRRKERQLAREEKERIEEEKSKELQDDDANEDEGGEASLTMRKLCLKGDQSSIKALKKLFKNGDTSVFDRDPHGWTTLHWACSQDNDPSNDIRVGDTVEVRPATAKGTFYYAAEIMEVSNVNGKTVYDVEFIQSEREERDVPRSRIRISKLDMVLFLLEKGAKLNVTEKTNGWTPLHLACMGGHIDIIKQLVKAGASTSKVDYHGATPKDCAGPYSGTSIGKRIENLLVE